MARAVNIFHCASRIRSRYSPRRTGAALSNYMNLPAHRVRRAVIDDRPALHALWTAMHIAPDDLDRRLTEFQVVESEGGQLLGALAMEIQGGQGRIHSETFSDFALSVELREQLW